MADNQRSQDVNDDNNRTETKTEGVERKAEAQERKKAAFLKMLDEEPPFDKTVYDAEMKALEGTMWETANMMEDGMGSRLKNSAAARVLLVHRADNRPQFRFVPTNVSSLREEMLTTTSPLILIMSSNDEKIAHCNKRQLDISCRWSESS